MTFGKGLRSAEDTVSIHATLAGGDVLFNHDRDQVIGFLSTPPSRVATPCGNVHDTGIRVSIHATLAGGDFPLGGFRWRAAGFYPRHPRGWRLVKTTPGTAWNSFYPRHPRGWRQRLLFARLLRYNVSIHATLAGGDIRPITYVGHRTAVSIHATLAGGDSCARVAPVIRALFLSTPPSRVATIGKCVPKCVLKVSIHATLAGGDMRKTVWIV